MWSYDDHAMNHGPHAKKDAHHTVIIAWPRPCFSLWSWYDHGIVVILTRDINSDINSSEVSWWD